MLRCCRSTGWSSARPRLIEIMRLPAHCRGAARLASSGPRQHHEVHMRLTQSLFFLVAAALALAVGSGYAEDKIGKDDNDPGFHALDKNKDGYLSRTEAAANPMLAKKFKEADKNGDGK